MKKSLVSMLAAAAVVGSATAATAQLPTTPFSIEVRGGLALPTGDLSDADAESGVTYGINGQFMATSAVSVYAGWTRSEFSVEDADDVDVHAEGFNFGVMGRFPMPGLTPFVKAGGTYSHLDISEGNDSDSSDDELGFEVGGGVILPLGNRISVTPAVTYSSFSAGDELDLDISHIRVDVGLNFRI